jgi:hypothetical protein
VRGPTADSRETLGLGTGWIRLSVADDRFRESNVASSFGGRASREPEFLGTFDLEGSK